jgi:competence protein ComEC
VLYKEIPFLRISVPLYVGIVSGLYLKPDSIFIILLSLLSISVFCISLLYNHSFTNKVFGFSLNLSLILLGLLLYRNEKDSLSLLKSEKTLFSCTLTEFPEEKEKSYLLKVKLNYSLNTEPQNKLNGSMLLYLSKDSSKNTFLPGDIMLISCTPQPIKNNGNPNEFDYRFYMENNGIKYFAFINHHDIKLYRNAEKRKLIYNALIIREKIIGMYKERGISGKNLALVAAITLGQKNMLDTDQKQVFIKAGVMHIMAVSGLHTVILSLFIFNLFFFLKKRFMMLRIIITVTFLWFFAFITGLTPSVLRATLMFSFIQAGGVMKRNVNSINSVLASAFILSLIKPSVIFDSGFLLSYSAVIFIISFYKDFYSLITFKNWITDKIWQSVVVTIVAQLGTLPLTILLFNRFPTYFIIANLIIVPLSSLLVIIGCLIPIVYIIKPLSYLLAFLLDRLTSLTEYITSIVSSLPFSTINNIGITTPECIFMMTAVFICTFFILKKKKLSILIPLSSLLIYTLTTTITDVIESKENRLIVYNSPNITSIGIKTGLTMHLFTDSTVISNDVIKHCSARGIKLKIIKLEEDIYYISSGRKKILISNMLSRKILENKTPDIIILTGNKPLIENNIIFNKFPEVIIVSTIVNSGFSVSKKLNYTNTDNIHYIRKSGAYILKI